MKKNSGFTLIELMITVAIAAVTLSFAVSTFRSVVVTNKVATEVNDFVAGLNLARSEAVKRSGNAGLVAVAGGWGAGWDVRIDANRDGDLADVGDSIIRSWRSSSSNMGWVNNDTVTTVMVDARGGIGTETSFTVTPASHDCPSGVDRIRTISISITGHASIARAACS